MTISNPLVTAQQLQDSASTLDGIAIESQDSVRYAASGLIQNAVVLLRLPQELAAHAIYLLCRFWVGQGSASMLEYDAKVSGQNRFRVRQRSYHQDVAATALYLAAKPSGNSIAPRPLLTAFQWLVNVSSHDTTELKNWKFADGSYFEARDRMYNIEQRMLRLLGFQTAFVVPYAICINYLQALDVFVSSSGAALARRAIQNVNTALFSPQLLLLTHQPSAIAVASIYLAAREIGLKLPDTEWWEVFDVDREDLGFLVVAIQSVQAFVAEEAQLWKTKALPLTVDALRATMQQEK